MRGSVKENQPDVHVMMLQKCLDGLYGGIQCLLVRIAVDAAGYQRKGNGPAAVFCCQRQAGAVAGNQQIFAFLRGLPAVDRSRGVDDVCGGRAKAGVITACPVWMGASLSQAAWSAFGPAARNMAPQTPPPICS